MLGPPARRTAPDAQTDRRPCRHWRGSRGQVAAATAKVALTGRGAALAPGPAAIIAGPQKGGSVNMARRGSFLTGARLLILASALTSLATSAQAARLVVDDDRVECPQAGFTTIQ